MRFGTNLQQNEFLSNGPRIDAVDSTLCVYDGARGVCVCAFVCMCVCVRAVLIILIQRRIFRLFGRGAASMRAIRTIFRCEAIFRLAI